jgi:hypothetical protein
VSQQTLVQFDYSDEMHLFEVPVVADGRLLTVFVRTGCAKSARSLADQYARAKSRDLVVYEPMRRSGQTVCVFPKPGQV